MMFAWLTSWFFGAIVMPSSNALMSKRIAPDAQGELQGAVACLFSLGAIVGPPLMTSIFSHFADPNTRPHVPGAAFYTATGLAWMCLAIFWSATRDPSRREAGAVGG
jgi:DHA1 family tetracycline resistance protein-like MFS transporter